MRDAYDEQLDAVTEGVVEMTHLAADAIRRATTALLAADLELAEAVIASDDDVDALQVKVEDAAFRILALQAPVAGDLRRVVATLHMCGTIERMADMAEHVAAAARRRYPASAVPPSLRELVQEMGDVAERLALKAGRVVATQDVETALELDGDDDRMDHLHRTLLLRLLADEQDDRVETAIDLALVGHYYERFADHAVSVARRVVFLATGKKHDELTTPTP